MNIKSKKQIKKGGALVYIIMIFTFVVLVTTALLTMLNTNFQQSYQQQKGQQAYYAALAGIELASTALLKVDVDSNGADRTLIMDAYETYKSNIANAPVLRDTITVGGGKALITVKGVNESSQNWVAIESIGIVNDVNGREVKRRAQLKINLDNQELVQWKSGTVD